MVAALSGFRWPTCQPLIVSVGTSHYRQTRPARAIIADPVPLQFLLAYGPSARHPRQLQRAFDGIG